MEAGSSAGVKLPTLVLVTRDERWPVPFPPDEGWSRAVPPGTARDVPFEGCSLLFPAEPPAEQEGK